MAHNLYKFFYNSVFHGIWIIVGKIYGYNSVSLSLSHVVTNMFPIVSYSSHVDLLLFTTFSICFCICTTSDLHAVLAYLRLQLLFLRRIIGIFLKSSDALTILIAELIRTTRDSIVAGGMGESWCVSRTDRPQFTFTNSTVFLSVLCNIW